MFRPNRKKGLLMRSILKCFAFSVILALTSVTARSETLTVGVASFPESLQVGLSTNISLSVNRQFMNGLVARNNAGEIVPHLAESWDLVNDATWRFHLRHDVKFHDGAAFTADDAKYTLDHALDPKSAYGRMG